MKIWNWIKIALGIIFSVLTYLRMLGQHLTYEYKLGLGKEQLDHLILQEKILKDERKKYGT